MTPDEASELAEFLDWRIGIREAGGQWRLSVPRDGEVEPLTFCPFGAADRSGWPWPTPDRAAMALGLNSGDTAAFMRGFDHGERSDDESTARELGVRYRRIALGEQERPW